MNSQFPLRQYLEAIKKECSELNRQELIQIILGLAKETQSAGRGEFLQILRSLLPQSDQKGEEGLQDKIEKLLSDIEVLHDEIIERLNGIEDGSYWDDPDEEDWQDEYYLDEDPDLLSDKQMLALASFFGEADHFFLHGDKVSAEKIYDTLLSVVKKVEEFGALPDPGINLHEIRARFARCVYELSPEKERIKTMLAAMSATRDEEEFEAYFSREYPLLMDVVNAETDTLEGFETFLTSWKTALGNCSFTINRAADLLLEATYMDDGVSAVGELARAWREKQPLGYLYWLEKLETEKKWQDLRDGAIEALNTLPPGGNRQKVSDHLIAAGEQLGDDGVILTGYREMFRSKPGNNTLLDFLTEAKRQQVRAKELEKIVEICSEQKKRFDDNPLLTKVLLMAGKVDQAFQDKEKSREVGWSNSSTGLLFASSLYLLADENEGCSLIEEQLRDYSEGMIYFDSYEPKPRASRTSCYDEIVYGLNLADKSSLNLDNLKKWAGTLGESRINHIVSNKHRRAYGRAATVLGSLAELISTSGDKNKAQNLLNEYCKVLFNRHVAFRREVKTAIGRSEILRGMGLGW